MVDKQYFRDYEKRPSVKARRKAYRQRPEVKERLKLYRKRTKERERLRLYRQEYRARKKIDENSISVKNPKSTKKIKKPKKEFVILEYKFNSDDEN